MKKILLTAACLFVASQASAGTIGGLSMDFYDASRLHTGYSTIVTGFINTTAATGHLVGDAPFFGGSWQADVMWASETAGANTWGGVGGPVWDGTGYSNIPFSYNFTLAAGNVAVGLFWDWEYESNVPVLAILHPNGDGSLSWVDQVWTDANGHAGKGMQTDPFPGTFMAFSAVPEPASLLLIGSGLAGLAGLGSRRRGH